MSKIVFAFSAYQAAQILDKEFGVGESNLHMMDDLGKIYRIYNIKEKDYLIEMITYDLWRVTEIVYP